MQMIDLIAILAAIGVLVFIYHVDEFLSTGGWTTKSVLPIEWDKAPPPKAGPPIQAEK